MDVKLMTKTELDEIEAGIRVVLRSFADKQNTIENREALRKAISDVVAKAHSVIDKEQRQALLQELVARDEAEFGKVTDAEKAEIDRVWPENDQYD